MKLFEKMLSYYIQQVKARKTKPLFKNIFKNLSPNLYSTQNLKKRNSFFNFFRSNSCFKFFVEIIAPFSINNLFPKLKKKKRLPHAGRSRENGFCVFRRKSSHLYTARKHRKNVTSFSNCFQKNCPHIHTASEIEKNGTLILESWIINSIYFYTATLNAKNETKNSNKFTDVPCAFPCRDSHPHSRFAHLSVHRVVISSHGLLFNFQIAKNISTLCRDKGVPFFRVFWENKKAAIQCWWKHCIVARLIY